MEYQEKTTDLLQVTDKLHYCGMHIHASSIYFLSFTLYKLLDKIYD